jgi:hypothetical protein
MSEEEKESIGKMEEKKRRKILSRATIESVTAF